ncbi:MAG: hypothetical protein J6M35_09585 [Clostridia bacterium]|nr:hypothetical protein [Clostridia bacterium]
MGFGLLFFGFMMMLDTGWTVSETYGIGLDVFPDILGYICMYRSMKHLRKSSKDLNIFAWITVALSILGGVLLVGQIAASVMRFVYPAGLEDAGLFIMICGYVKNPIMLAAILFLTSGLKEVANSVGLYPLAKKTTVVSVVSSLYYLIQSVFTVTSAGNIAVPSFVFFGAALLFYVQLIMMLALIFSYYRQVGYEGEDTSVKEHPLEKLRKKLKNAANEEDDDD